MGRKVKVPLKSGKIVPASSVSQDASTPHSYSDIDWAVMRRLGFGDEIPSFADDKG